MSPEVATWGWKSILKKSVWSSTLSASMRIILNYVELLECVSYDCGRSLTAKIIEQ